MGVMYRVVESYSSPYMRGVTFRAGERLRFERRESEWDGWMWCTSEAGEEAWTPEAWVEIEGDDTCTMKRDYNARELSVAAGDEVRAIEEQSGWAWCANAAGETGWVPLSNLEKQ